MHGGHRDLHVLAPSLPTRRFSDLGHQGGDRASHHLFHRHSPFSSFGPSGLWSMKMFCPIRIERSLNIIVGCRSAFGSEILSFRLPPLYPRRDAPSPLRSEEHTSELQSLMRISYAVFCLKKKTQILRTHRKVSDHK